VAQLVAGVDPHKRSLTLAVVTSVGEQVATASFDNSEAGVAAALGWLRTHEPGLARVGIEGSAGHGRHLAECLVTAGMDVREVPPRRTAARRRGRRPAKTDVEDALAIARATAGETGLGPVKPGTGLGAAIDELGAVRAHRDMLVARRKVMLNRAEAALGRLPLAVTERLGATRGVLPRLRALARLNNTSPDSTGPGSTGSEGGGRSAVLATLLAMLEELRGDVTEVDRRIRGLERRMTELITASGSTLLDEHGIGVIGAATLLVEVGDPARFRSEAAFNRWWGGAPVAISSGEGHGRPVRHRLDLLGNRAVNSVFYIASVTQARYHQPAQAYLARKTTEGHSTREARRAHKTLLGRRIIRRMWADRRRQLAQQHPSTDNVLTAAA
jgi:transposase